ncbi:phosphate transporter family protein [Ancylostoma caninum]|uniref:Phosphate transporter family protein n=1 Tax=Ancylostoma caninum TaxID=29170 RepID=A0A368FJE4_ANCCA|nr:phosphate transporter family protein [Ancylostoma caninum]
MIEDLAAFQSALLPWLVVGAIIAFILAFAIGANDTANSFGHKVTDTMRKGVLDLSVYNNSELELMYGQISILSGCGAWMLLATFFKLPVSTTHSIVGATIGFSLVLKGSVGIRWYKISRIFASWIVSPLLSGIVSVVFFIAIDHFVLRKSRPLASGLKILPVLYFACMTFNVFAIIYEGSEFLYFDRLTLKQCALVSVAFGVVSALVAKFIIAPWLKRSILARTDIESNNSSELNALNLQKAALLEYDNDRAVKDVKENGSNGHGELIHLLYPKIPYTLGTQ